MTIQRVYLAALALAPALAVLLFPLPALSAPVTLTLGGAGGLVGILASFGQSGGAARRGAAQRLLRDPRGLPDDLPDIEQARRLLIQATLVVDDSPGAPPGRDSAIAEVLTGVMQGWGHAGAETLPRALVQELTVLDRLLRASPQEAGALAQYFARPDLMLDLRDGVNEIAAHRAVHDRNRAAFEASQVMWEAQNRGQAPHGLLPVLRALNAPDPDLWHRVILGHDRTDPDQREAALWCVEQPGCDRASIALYMAELAAGDALLHAARRGDDRFLDRILTVIQGLNDGAYGQSELALDPVDAVAGDTQRFNTMLAALAEQTGAMRWPAPCGLFTEYAGRAPYARDHWCLRSGRLIAAPDVRDYFPAGQGAA
ncbi:hypothetical protein [Tropicibacter oceani]|uniref:DUF4375 domain-containing protein n=1 Tax=Tropicibacter oceani TaxID=3058420 RepID=A0ABY8QEP7_9RHOB|nr:hypothetical protein [Tropicibacter oceani]WGW03104.1 hypothetical protein QF118_14365 [Tropicibacter oceani]